MYKLLFVFIFSIVVQASAWAGTPTANSQPFYDQIQQLDAIAPYVERTDYSRLLVIRKSVEQVIQSMEDNVASGLKEVTFQTLRLIQNVIVQYRFSQVYFGWSEPKAVTSIYVEAVAANIDQLKILSDTIVKEFGFDDSPYTQITANTFRQMQRLLQQLETLPLEQKFKDQLRALWPGIGEVIAIAEQGDRPKTFEKAIPMVDELKKLYPLFNQVSAVDAAFEMVMELQGLNEFYAEFAQIEEN